MLLKPVRSYSHKILSILNMEFNTYKKIGKQDLSRLATVRASSLPFCVRSFLVNAARGQSELDASGAFYTSVGTTVHTWIQDIAGRSGHLLGNWYNKETKKWRRFSLCPDPTDTNWIYEELQARVLGAVGHCDGVICLSASKAKKANKQKSEKKRIKAFAELQVPLFVIDYKTCTIYSVNSKINASGVGYTLQLLFYCLHFHELGLNVVGYGNFYIPRDNPRKWGMNSNNWDSRKRKYIMKAVKHWVAVHKKALRAKSWRQFCILFEEGKCENEWCSVCIKRNPKEVLQEAFKSAKWPIADRLKDQKL